MWLKSKVFCSFIFEDKLCPHIFLKLTQFRWSIWVLCAEHCAGHCTFLFSVIYHLIRNVKLAGMRQSQQCKNIINGIMLTKGHAVQQMEWSFWSETVGRSHGRAESYWALKDRRGKDILWSGRNRQCEGGVGFVSERKTVNPLPCKTKRNRIPLN